MGKKKGGKSKSNAKRKTDARGYSTGTETKKQVKSVKPAHTTQASAGGGNATNEPNAARIKIPFELEERLLSLLKTTCIGRQSVRSQRVTKPRLEKLYDTLGDIGFADHNVEEAMECCLGQPLEDHLDWLCMHVANNMLPAGYTDKYLEDRHANLVEVPQKPKSTGNQRLPEQSARTDTDVEMNNVFAPQTAYLHGPAAISTPESSDEAHDEVKCEFESMRIAAGETPRAAVVDKSWILNYAETYTSSDESEYDDRDVAPISTTDRICGLETRLTELISASANAKSEGNSALQKEHGAEIGKCRSELANLLKSGEYDIELVSQHQAKEEQVRDENKKNRVSVPKEQEKVIEEACAAQRESDDENIDASIFDCDNGLDEHSETSATSHQIDPDGRYWPTSFDYAGFTGSVPSDLLAEWCRNNKLKPPKFSKFGTKGNYKFNVRVEVARDRHEDAGFDSTVKTVKEGRDLAATLLLYQLASSSRINSRLPKPFQDVWDQLALKDSIIAHEESLIANTRRNDFIAKLSGESIGDMTTQSGIECTQPDIGKSQSFLSETRHKIGRPTTSCMIGSASTQIQNQRAALPAIVHQIKILDCIQQSQVTVLSGDTGCGKSTQVPQLILRNEMEQNPRNTRVNIICTQPRRISAVTIAQRVSSELGVSTGELCGYQVRLDNMTTASTRLTFCTTGILLRQIQGNPTLEGITHIVVDEIHERSIDSDFLLVLLKRLLPIRTDLKVILMSATINADAFSKYFYGCGTISIPGRAFPVTQLFLEDVIERTNYDVEDDSENCLSDDSVHPDRQYILDLDISERSRATLQKLDETKINYDLIEACLLNLANLGCSVEGSVLIFLPGMANILRLHSILTSNPEFYKDNGWDIIPLHSSIGRDDQARAFLTPPHGVRKVVLATNIAETGITIPDCTVVIDSGKEKRMQFREHTKMNSLDEVDISKASVRQRAGRAGRVQAGICIHMYTEKRFRRFSDFTPPEMTRSSLESLVLYLLESGFGAPVDILSKTMDPPTDRALANAESTLVEVGAIKYKIDERDQMGRHTQKSKHSGIVVTALGRHLARLPVEIHIGKMMVLSAILGCVDVVTTIAAALSVGTPFVAPFNQRTAADAARRRFVRGSRSDLFASFFAFNAWERATAKGRNQVTKFCRENFISDSIMRTISGFKKDFSGLLISLGFDVSIRHSPAPNDKSDEGSIRVAKAAIFAGLYPQVAIMDLQTSSPPRLMLPFGHARLHPSSCLSTLRSSIGIEVTEIVIAYTTKLKTSETYIRDCTEVDPIVNLLFANQVNVDHGKSMVIIDGWMHLSVPAKTAVLLKELRYAIDEVLESKSSNPQQKVDNTDVVKILLELLCIPAGS